MKGWALVVALCAFGSAFSYGDSATSANDRKIKQIISQLTEFFGADEVVLKGETPAGDACRVSAYAGTVRSKGKDVPVSYTVEVSNKSKKEHSIFYAVEWGQDDTMTTHVISVSKRADRFSMEIENTGVDDDGDEINKEGSLLTGVEFKTKPFLITLNGITCKSLK